MMRLLISPRALFCALLFLLVASCGTSGEPEATVPLDGPEAAPLSGSLTQLEMQSLVMAIADDYSAGIAEAVYSVLRKQECTPRQRWLAQSFLRNGMGAALDIGAGSNPSVALLDLLVLTRLQSRSFAKHWAPLLGPAGGPASELLAQADSRAWSLSSRALSPAQQGKLAGMADAWLARNPERYVVSLVRFGEFTDQRRMPAAVHEQARGLLADLDEATTAVEEATLLGERLIWLSSRLPYVLGQQTELTTYRIADQPEVREVTAAVESARKLTERLDGRLRTLDADLDRLLDGAFTRLEREREALLEDATGAVDEQRQRALEDLSQRVESARSAALEDFFDRFARERHAFFDDLEDRKETLLPVVKEFNGLLRAGNELARSLTVTVSTLDRLAARFDEDPDDPSPPLDINDVTAAARETGTTIERLNLLLERLEKGAGTRALDEGMARADALAAANIDRVFYRALILVLTLIAGLVLLRLLPARGRRLPERA